MTRLKHICPMAGTAVLGMAAAVSCQQKDGKKEKKIYFYLITDEHTE